MKINLCFAVLIHPTEESLLIWPVDPFPPRDQWLLFKERCTTHTPRRPTSRNHLHSVTRSLHSAIISFRGTVEACEWDGAGSRGGGGTSGCLSWRMSVLLVLALMQPVSHCATVTQFWRKKNESEKRIRGQKSSVSRLCSFRVDMCRTKPPLFEVLWVFWASAYR